MSRKNPFERYDIDPMQGPTAITARLRELAEDAGEDERAEIRAAWEELTLHPLRRLSAAFGAHPETRPPLGLPPRSTPLDPVPRAPARSPAAPGAEHPSAGSPGGAVDPPLALRDLALRPPIASALGDERRPGPRPTASLDDDPILQKASDVR